MKRHIYIIASVIAAFILTGCYEIPNLIHHKFDVSSLQTKPVSGNYLQGEYTGSEYYGSSFFFQISDDSDISGKASIIDAEWTYDEENGDKIKVYSPVPSMLETGIHYYRLGMACAGDTVYAKNIESFEIKYWARMDRIEPISSFSAQFWGNSNIEVESSDDFYNGNYEVTWRVSWDSSFEDYITTKAESASFNEKLNEWHFTSSIQEDLEPGQFYYVKLCITHDGQTMESEPESFRTFGLLQFGSVTYTDWDGNTYYLEDKYESFHATIISGPDYFENKVIQKSIYGYWEMPEYLPVYRDGLDAIGYITDASHDYSDSSLYGLQTYYYRPQELLWARTDRSKEEYVDLNFRHMMSRVIFHMEVDKDFPIENPYISRLKVEGGVMTTYADFALWEGNFFDKDCKNPFVEGTDITLVKGETIDHTIYSLPSNGSDSAILSMVLENNGYQFKTPIEISWESGRTYEYTVTLTATGLKISDVYIRPWNPVEGGDINITENNK